MGDLHLKNTKISILFDAILYKVRSVYSVVHNELNEKYTLEARCANDLVGVEPFCRRKLFYDKKYPADMPEMSKALELIYHHMATDEYAKKHRIPRKFFRRRHVINRGHEYKFMSCLPERGIFMGDKGTWQPMYIDIVDEPTFFARSIQGLKTEYNNVAQFALDVKKESPFCVYAIYCPTLGRIKDWKIDRDKETGEYLANLAVEMNHCLQRGKYPPQTVGEHCQECLYFTTCLRKNEPRSGDFDKDMESIVNQHLVAKKALKQASRNLSIIERTIDEMMGDRDSVCTSEFELKKTAAHRWKIDGERLSIEQPEITRLYKIQTTEKKLTITR